MGSDDPWAYQADGEGPVREVSLDSFWNGRRSRLQRGLRCHLTRVSPADPRDHANTFDGMSGIASVGLNTIALVKPTSM